MKKIFVGLALMLGAVLAFGQASTATAPSGGVAASAAVVCKDGKAVTSTASGNGARAVATCGNVPAPKPVAKKAPQPAKPAGEAFSQDSAATVKALAEANVALKLQQQQSVTNAKAPSTFAPAPSMMEEGRVYSDADGNTVERHTAGTRECKVFANGQLVARAFVDGDKASSKKACDLFAAETLAKMRPTSPDGRDTSGPLVVNLPKQQDIGPVLPPSTPVAGGNPGHICAMTFDGKPVFEPIRMESEAACNAHREKIARERGWVRSPQQSPASPRPTT